MFDWFCHIGRRSPGPGLPGAGATTGREPRADWCRHGTAPDTNRRVPARFGLTRYSAGGNRRRWSYINGAVREIPRSSLASRVFSRLPQ